MNEGSPGGSLIDKRDYISDSDWNALQEFVRDKETPCLVLFKKKVKKNYKKLKSSVLNSDIYYAVKACPNPEILKILNELGSNFDIASRYELDLILSLGVTADRISFGNTIKKEKDISYAYKQGVRLFATDSHEDLAKIARSAPGACVFFRLLVPAFGADWPLSRKFGSEIPIAYELALRAKEFGLIPYGISFHVGSQQNDLYSWDVALSKTKELYDDLVEAGIKLEMINIGGGLPAPYLKKVQSTGEYLETIENFIRYHFENEKLRIIMEPGRSMVGDIGVIVSEVVLVSRKSNNENDPRWIYLDIGKFSGLIETLDESIKYPIYTDVIGETSPVILAGPTCDSMDILYEKYQYHFPNTIRSGDKVYIFTTGAYTQSYSAVEFNGFPPLQAYVI